ncbi:hypothetical protein SAMN04487915_106175 [Arthrobacter sp. ov118]|nr:hypothetical protein SAMN04487915_106175 [Arthrobacter sp. ov118]
MLPSPSPMSEIARQAARGLSQHERAEPAGVTALLWPASRWAST